MLVFYNLCSVKERTNLRVHVRENVQPMCAVTHQRSAKRKTNKKKRMSVVFTPVKGKTTGHNARNERATYVSQCFMTRAKQ